MFYPQHPWVGDDFAPCFRETLIPLLILVWSTTAILTAGLRYRQSISALYTPLKNSLPTFSSYGATVLPNDVHDSDEDDVSSNGSTLAPDYEEQSTRWSLYSWSRLLVVFQLALYTCALHRLFVQKYTLDADVEGSIENVIYAHGIHAVYWAFALILAIANISVSSTPNILTDQICSKLNILYVCDFLIGLVNLRSFYIVHGTSDWTPGYSLALYSCCISFVLLIFVINEERHAPLEPVISDTGRVMSGEHWASLYSKFMFSWVNAMMKEGNKRTLNDEDLIELPAENRAKNTVSDYRQHKAGKMYLSLLKTFRGPLLVQMFYSLVNSIVIFGPPYFLNKIIKFIENKDPNTSESFFTAFLYVLGLFLTSSAQSLALQQALYIGRTLGIRIQSVVIGEVFSKSLRRRDESGASQDESESADKAKGNINNLLSVDAQKIGELTAYIFYVYAYPLQICISIWSLYKLLGNASLWGVLVIILTQPLTYYVTHRFETLHKTVMATTDKRLKIMNELLSAIRIVKFFAWEKQFRKRVVDAREVELKAIRARLMMFMWMGNVWFLVPVLIMVTVFYVYTKTTPLTASVAFTALALFNNFRGALDEFPLIISFVMQAHVSIKRIENFLDEDEVEIVTSKSANGVHIGFVDNASFSWDKKVGSDEDAIALKDLNLSFPPNKLSIVCGPTGSGKTTLLASLFGETHCVSGAAILPRKVVTRSSPLGGAVSGIAYVAQTAWLQNCSIRDNILFGLPYDNDRYEKVLYMTALTRDLEILEFGDSTEVGEKGITLSGGQKQRVAIARAVYSQAETVVLDDCLSAVDAHTAKHLYEHCLTGELMRHRTVILVTHHVGLCIKGASYVVALKDGKVAGAGEPSAMIKSGVLGDELSHAEQEEADEQEEASTDGPIPNVPKTVKKSQENGAGKLTQEEVRAEGGVAWSVYATYFYASGGLVFWVAVLFLFCLAQGSVLGQDYWIKVWAAAYDGINSIATGIFAASRMGSAETSFMSLTYMQPVQRIGSDTSAVDVTYYLGIYFLIGMIALAVTSARSLILYYGSLSASRHIHARLLDRILRAKVRFFDVTPLGRIVNRFSSDLETIDQAVAPSFSFLLYSVVATVCIVILVSVVTPAFLIPGVFIAFVFWTIGSYYLNTSRDLKRLNSVSRSPIYVQFNETVNGVATIRAFGCQNRFLEENFKKIDCNNRSFIWMWATNRWLHCRVDILGAFVGFCTGFVLIMSRSWVNAGLAGLSLSYSLMFTHHVLWIVRMYAVNEMNAVSIERVHEYLDVEEEPAAHVPNFTPRPTWPEHGAVQVQDLVMQYAPENPPVLRNISFETRPREKIGIVGRTGSGKSTFALSLFRFMEATSGRILIDGIDISKIGLNDLRSRLTIIPQDPVLFSGTLRSNLDPFDEHDDAELWAALKRSHLIDEQSPSETAIQLDAPVTENGNNWSQGQRQLIALARALVKKSSLIILDEATSSVDFDTDHKIQQTIRTEFNKSALLCIAHRIRTVADYDRILVLDHGEVVEFDTPYALMMSQGSVFQQMCIRSGEFTELFAIAKAKNDRDQQ
ncbi:hypothetical protein DFQ28_008764 [Apophysomyces sp. BC1034]|nr:hypothetical protein DFQ28_008764 [Apophysomyces sp. BC1034]